ncbi:cysteine hydrolase family protein [Neobacillus niacini]|uniref:cysteine hydrolase family protein n=1 Tax=Neobacillus niacini TaxID=86668 RepID=UPI0021CB879F|nr:cysteine hydrolase family protein [Neobacillus niacini]MCM3766915.1 cysteine hydrolase [Neobacillus niacini]
MEDKRSALLVIDVQVGPMWGTYKKDETFVVIQTMISKAEQENVPIFYIQFEGPENDLLERGSQFWQFAPGITPRKEDIVIHKRGADSFFQTELQEELHQHNITHLFVVGVRTEYCIDTTCRAALSLGFDVTLIADGHTTVDECIPAEQIIYHHNNVLSRVSTPERRIMVQSSNEVEFD